LIAGEVKHSVLVIEKKQNDRCWDSRMMVKSNWQRKNLNWNDGIPSGLISLLRSRDSVADPLLERVLETDVAETVSVLAVGELHFSSDASQGQTDDHVQSLAMDSLS
jgi:hypothetical protein